MQEAKFSCTFKMFNANGGSEQFTVRGDSLNEFVENRTALSRFIENGYFWSAPEEKEKPRTEHIIGYVVGETKTQAICLHLYKRGLKFKAYTLYPEDKHLFPLPYPTRAEWMGAAPEKDDAVMRGVFHELEFDLPVVPVTDPDGNPVKNNAGYTQYRPHRYYNKDGDGNGSEVRAQAPGAAPQAQSKQKPSPGIVQYVHKRRLPNVGKYTADQIGTLSADEPLHNAWWGALSSAEQDALMYGRMFVATYKKSPASPHGMKIWDSITSELAEKTGMDKRAVSVYASYALTDYAQDPEQPQLTGVVQWLAECANKTKANGETNPNYDPEWMAAFAAIIQKIHAIESGGGDSAVPFDFGDESDDGEELAF